jgi:5-(aminomethyl)-3-furanmethanol phosphate kinase
MSDAWTVVKVGGSLFDWPELRGRLSAWLDQLDRRKVLLVPGGGATADAIRALDQTHRLGEEASHWLAIQALSINARLLQALLPSAYFMDIGCVSGSQKLYLLDAMSFFQADDENLDHLPHTWEVTSDSLAVRAATLMAASELILLKSASWDGNDWEAASKAGIVDGYFAAALQQAPADLRVKIVNLRTFT